MKAADVEVPDQCVEEMRIRAQEVIEAVAKRLAMLVGEEGLIRRYIVEL